MSTDSAPADSTTPSTPTTPESPADVVAAFEAEITDLRAAVEAATVFFGRIAKLIQDLAAIKARIKALIPSLK